MWSFGTNALSVERFRAVSHSSMCDVRPITESNGLFDTVEGKTRHMFVEGKSEVKKDEWKKSEVNFFRGKAR